MKKLRANEKRKFFFIDNARFHKGDEMVKYTKVMK